MLRTSVQIKTWQATQQRGKQPMNANQIINMITRIIMRKAINKGIDVGLNRATRGRKQSQHPPAPGQDDNFEEMTPDATVQPVKAQKPNAKNAPEQAGPEQDGPSQAEVRRKRRAKRAARQARQAAKAKKPPRTKS
jgi:hypothetical protein